MKQIVAIAILVFSLVVAPGAATAAPAPSGPRIDNSTLGNGGYGCSNTSPPRPLSELARILQALGTDDTAISTPFPTFTYTFQLHPIADPANVITAQVVTYQPGQYGVASLDPNSLTDGTAYSWRVRLADPNGTSKWSRSCTFDYDITAPTAAPTVSSNYPEGFIYGPAGQPARFTFGNGGDSTVFAYQYGWSSTLPVLGCEDTDKGLQCPDLLSQPGIVAASADGTASVTLLPPDDGPQMMYVRALDRAENESPTTGYQIFVPSVAPAVAYLDKVPNCSSTVHVAVAPNPALTGVRAYRYSLNYGPETTVRARSDGSADLKIPVTPQSFSLEIRSVSSNGYVSDPAFQVLNIDPVPGVQSTIYLNSGEPVGGVGVTGTFTFSAPSGYFPTAYVYRFGGGPRRVVAAPDGNVTVTWTPTAAGPTTLTVRASDQSIGPSCQTSYTFLVAGAPASK